MTKYQICSLACMTACTCIGMFQYDIYSFGIHGSECIGISQCMSMSESLSPYVQDMVLEKNCIIFGMYKWYSIVHMYCYNCSGTVASLQLLSRLLQLLSFYKSCHITFLQLITSDQQLVQLLKAAFSDWMSLNWKVYCLFTR